MKPHRVDPNPNNFKFLSTLINKAKYMGMPVLGICAGSWAVNVATMGSLKQKIEGDDNHVTHVKDPRNGEVIHSVTINNNTRLLDLVQKRSIRVNSWHDQAIGRLGQGLMVSATAPDGTIEAIEGQYEPFLLGIQFHPEYLVKKTSDRSDDFLLEEDIHNQLNIFYSMVYVAIQYANKKQLNLSFFNNQPNENYKQMALLSFREHTERILQKNLTPSV